MFKVEKFLTDKNKEIRKLAARALKSPNKEQAAILIHIIKVLGESFGEDSSFPLDIQKKYEAIVNDTLKRLNELLQ